MMNQPQPMPTPMNVFYSYAHEDEVLRDELEKHLSLLQRQGIITSWHDRKIVPGTNWTQTLDRNLNSASIILLLISADFLASDYCYSIEMERAMERHKAKEARVIPIILRPADWKSAPFATLQALPAAGKPVTNWSSQDDAFLDVTAGIRRVVHELLMFDQAHSSMMAKDYKQALEIYDNVLQLQPDSAVANAGKGDALSHLKRYEEAIAAYDYALQLDPTISLSNNERGTALLAAKQYEEALVAYDQAIACDPSIAAAYSGKGDVLSHLHRYDEALDNYNQAIKIDPTSPHTYIAKGQLLERLAQEAYAEAMQYGGYLKDDRPTEQATLSRMGFRSEANRDRLELFTLLSTITHTHRFRRYLGIYGNYSDEFSIGAVAMAANGEFLASSGYEDPITYIYEGKTGHIVKTIRDVFSHGSFLLFSSDGQSLLGNCGVVDQNQNITHQAYIRMWDIKTDTSKDISSLGLGYIAADFDQQTLVGVGNNNGLTKMNLKTKETYGSQNGSGSNCLAVSVTGEIIVSRDKAHLTYNVDMEGIYFWDIHTLRLLHSIQGIDPRFEVTALAISPDGQHFASGHRNGIVKLWNLPNGQFLRAIAAHTDRVASIAFSPDGHIFVTGSYDGTIKIWGRK